MLKSSAFENILLRLNSLAKVLLIVGLFCLIFIMGHRAIFDLDIWLHLKTGEYIVQNKTVPTRDILSFTMAGKPWTDHSWLFQVLVYLIYHQWQADGLILLESLLIASAFFILFFTGVALTGFYLEAGILLAVTAVGCSGRFNIRPDLFSLLFFALFLYLLKLRIDKKILWLLVPIQILWVNLHGYFFLGPMLILFFIIAELIPGKLPFLSKLFPAEPILSKNSLRRLRRIFLFVVLASLINPRGWRGAVYPLFVAREAMLGRMQIFMENIQELQPTLRLAGALGKFYIWLAVLCPVLMAVNFRRLKIIEIILFFFFFFLSFSHRNMAFFLFVCNLIIISNLGLILKNITPKIRLLKPFLQRLYFLVRFLATVVLIILLGLEINKMFGWTYYDFASKDRKSALIGVNQGEFPKAAVDFILENDLPGNLLNDFNSGAYLIGRAFPKRKVFIDGRTEFYGPDFFKKYLDALKGDIIVFSDIVQKYQISGVFISMARENSLPPLVGHLYKNLQWQLVYFDDSGIIFLKDLPENRELIKKHEIDLNQYTTSLMDLKELRVQSIYPTPYIKRAILFDAFQEDALVLSEVKEALRIMPHCAEAFYLIAKVYMRQGQYQAALENLRSSLLFVLSAAALVDLGTCYDKLRDAETAKNMFKKAIRISKNYAPAYYNLGCLYLSAGQEKEAVTFLQKAISYAAQEPNYYCQLAEAFYRRGERTKNKSDLKQAQANLNKSIVLNRRFQDKEAGKAIDDLKSKIEDKSQ